MVEFCEDMDSFAPCWLELIFYSGRWLGNISNTWIFGKYHIHPVYYLPILSGYI